MDLRKLVDDGVMLASPAAEQHKVGSAGEAGEDRVGVRMDADVVKQAILNVVLNGVQAMRDGGSLRIAARRDGDGALVSVRDQGPGIPADIRDKVFNLYFTTKKDGSGLGLAMAYRLVQLHHRSVEFTSVPGQGTTFYLRLPLAESVAGSEPARVASADSVSKA